MPNQITSAGIQVASSDELLNTFVTGLQSIYGHDISVNSDDPDGQLINIIKQSALDMEDLVVSVFNSMDPDLAIGRVLDARVAINGIARLGGTFTITNITIEVDRALTLTGLDTADATHPVFTVSDNAGNQFQLINTQNPVGAGTYVYAFQASTPGKTLTTPNTITVPVTVVLGVVSVNNPTVATTIGLDEESDPQLRARRQQSTSLSSKGYLAGLLAALENVNGVTTAIVYENDTDMTDGDGTPSHSIWVIVAGGAPADIANAIYTKRNGGCGMRGIQTYTLTQIDGSPFTLKWDNVTPENLYIQIHVTSIDGINPVNATLIQNQLVLRFVPGVFQTVNINELSTIVQEIDPNAMVVPTTGDGFSASNVGPFTNKLTPSAKNLQFAVSAPNISITVV